MRWLHFILSHSIFIAFCAVGLTYQTILLNNLFVDKWLLGFVFFATLLSYNFYWLLSKKIFGNVFYKPNFFKKEQYKIIALIIYLGAVVVCYLQSMLIPLLVLPAIVLNMFYALPLLPLNYLNGLRKIGVLKTIILAFTWMYVTAYLPLLKPINELTNVEIYVLLNRFMFMFLLCIMFDSRDSQLDKIKGLHSIATDIKTSCLKILVAILFVVLACTISLLLSLDFDTKFIISLIITFFATLVLYFLAQKKQGYLFYYFFVDGLMLFSSILTYVASI